MGKYEVEVSTGIDISEFGEFELALSYSQFIESRETIVWSIERGGSIVGAPVVWNDKIYFGACDGIFYCIESDGREVWRFATGGPIISFTSPLVADGRVFFGSYDRNLYCLDAQSGQEIWRFTSGGKIFGGPALYKETVYFGCEDGNLYALSANNGRMVWKWSTGAGISSMPAIADSKIYFGSHDGNFYCLDLSGRLLWKFQTGGYVLAQPAFVKAGMVYFGSQDRNFYCLTVDGKLMWKFRAGDTTYELAIDDLVYVASRDQHVYALDPKTGQLIWSYKTRGATAGKAALIGGMIYFGSWDCNLYAVKVSTGRLVWKFATHGPISSTTGTSDRLYVTSWDCNLYCLGLDGQLLWKFATSLSYQSKITPTPKMMARTAQVVWTPVTAEEKKKYTGGEMDIVDYGSFSGKYIDAGKSDYLGRKKKGYV